MATQTSIYVPRRGVFEATLKCNLRCKHCGSRAGKARDNELTIDEIRQMFSELKSLGMEWVTISGGEPTCREDWPEIIEAATRVGIRAGMITNAVVMDRDAVRTAKRKGLSGIGLSLDGGVAQTHDFIRGRIGHFRQLTQTMDICREERMPFAVLTHLNTRNLNELETIHQLIVEKGAYGWQIQLGTDMGNMSDHRDMLLAPGQLIGVEKTLAKMIKKSPIRIHPSDSVGYFGPNEKTLRKASGGNHFSGCGAGKTVIGIESNGNIKGCLSIMAGYNSKGQNFVEGNIRDTSLSEIWHREGAFSYTRNWSINELGGFCKTCDKASICKGGCTAKKVASGDGVENPMCIYRAYHEQRLSGQYISKQAAAITLAMLLGAGVAACEEDYGMPEDTDSVVDSDTHDSATEDSASDTTTSKDTATSVKDSDSDTGEPKDTEPVLEYGMPVDSDTHSVLEYGMPDYAMPTDSETDMPTDEDYGMPADTSSESVLEYGMPVDSDTHSVLEYGMPVDSDTHSVLEYGMPDYAMPTDSETLQTDYGFPAPPKK
ncbi:MAG: radical SAM protein [Deltaproteobacteria bacterium]|nr:radical SAM protein [Deltaproteobacteria bacterium]